MTETKIRWTDYSWNPTTGCSHVSPGCEHCYAEALSLRFHRSTKPWKAQFAAENVKLHPERLDVPRAWERKAVRTGEPIRCFVNSMSDLFHELIPFAYVDQVFAAMRWCPHVTFQVLTKRPERMREYMTKRGLELMEFPPINVWLGTSVEDQRRANERIPVLLETPAAVRFLSCEPLLGPVDLDPWLWRLDGDPNHLPMFREPSEALHWVICGGESGPRYRFGAAHEYGPAARRLRDQCVAAGVAFFHKQSPGPRTEMGAELDGRRWEEYPV